MEEILAFQSRSFPAANGADPRASDDLSSGIPLLKLILDLLDHDSMRVFVPPLAEGSGCSAYVSVSGTEVDVHLTWYQTGGRTGAQRDIWTLQVGPSGGWFKRLLRKARRRDDHARESVARAVEQVLRERTDEFSQVQTCTWTDLDR